jgi:CBS domain-containing protein
MLVSLIMQEKGREVVSVAADTLLSEVVQVLHKRRIGAVPVLHPDGTLAGILSERDVVSAIANDGGMALMHNARTYMTRDVNTCAETDETEDILPSMTSERPRYVPVVERNHVVGIVSTSDIIKSFVAETEYQMRELREILDGLSTLRPIP